MTDPQNHPASPPQQIIYAYPPDIGSNADDELDLLELWNVIWGGKWIIIAITTIFAVASVVYALSLPNIYRSEAVLAPSEEAQGGGLSKVAGQLGGLASLAGINIGSGEGVNKVAVALEVIKSRRFIANFVERHDILPELMAVENWHRSSNRITYDPDLYDATAKKWVREVDPPKTPQPSSWEAYKAFIKILTVSQDKETGFVTVAVEHHSPYIAEHWVKLLVEEINAVMKEQDVREAQRSVEYLTKQLDQVPLAEMRTVFYQLIEEQIQTMMLADVREEYIFSTIDPPVVPEEKIKPKRSLICVLGVILGGVLAVMFLLARHYLSRKDVDTDETHQV